MRKEHHPISTVIESETIPLSNEISDTIEDSTATDSTNADGEKKNYFVLEPQTTICGRDAESLKAAEAPDEILDESNHNYFVLEPQTAHCTCSESQDTIETANVEMFGTQVTQNHNYFVLEPQNTKAANTYPQKKSLTPLPDSSDPDKAQRQQSYDYFELEPQNTYSSIDPDDVVVQTLPENEYNTINMKNIPVSRDPNYGSLQTVGQTGKDIGGNGGYSHIQNNSITKMDLNEYSHTSFKNVKPQPTAAGDEYYSHLNGTMINAPGENDYSHVDAKLG